MINRSSILNEIPNLINQVSVLTQNGVIKTLPFKVSYGIAKNAKVARQTEQEVYEKRKELQKTYCVMEGKEPKMTVVKTEGQPDRHELTFETPEKKEQFTKAVGDFLNEEIKFDAFKINMDEIEEVDNLTPAILSTLEKYGIIE